MHRGSCKPDLLQCCRAFDAGSALLPDSVFPPPEQAASQWGEEMFANHFKIVSNRGFISPPSCFLWAKAAKQGQEA